MTGELRAALKQAVDARVRQRIADMPSPPRTHCKGCGADIDSYTLGCINCRDRFARYRRGQVKGTEVSVQQAAALSELRRLQAWDEAGKRLRKKDSFYSWAVA